MLTFEDCIELCDLPEEVIQAIATHERIPMMLALELGCKMTHTRTGRNRIRQFILDDIAHFRHNGDIRHTRYYERALKTYELTYPEQLPAVF